MPTPTRLALVDIGTNTTKFLTVRLTGSGFEETGFSKATTRLGGGLFTDGDASRAAIDATSESIRRFRAATNDRTTLFAFATYALRKARNAPAVIRTLERALGTKLHILSGQKEARFAWLSARRNLRLTKPYTVLVDIGGGSTELAIVHHHRVLHTRSYSLGALHLTERFIASDPPSANETTRLNAAVQKTVSSALARAGIAGVRSVRMDLIVSGGSAGTAVRMLTPRPHESDRQSCHSIRLGALDALRDRCATMTLSRRKQLRGLEPDRADIICAGLTILLEFMRGCGKRVALFNSAGVRHGAIIHLIENDFRW